MTSARRRSILPARRFAPTAVRIRSKMILLHTVFSLALAATLLLAIRPPVEGIIEEAEARDSLLAAELALIDRSRLDALGLSGVSVRRGGAAELGVGDGLAGRARAEPGLALIDRGGADGVRAVAWDEAAGEFVACRAASAHARTAVNNLFLLLTLALLCVYALIALTLEVFVLPRQVYGPIERLRRADEAVQAGRRAEELIPDSDIPRDELGEIMRSRNLSILKLREQERAINEALERFEGVAAELKKKNHLLTTARRNLEDQDRLVSLGMMSAGIAHELNTPLAVLKGATEAVAESAERGEAPSAERVGLMVRVLRRLERLSEGLLDFARARSPSMDRVPLRALLDEAWTLVSIDRGARAVRFENAVPGDLAALGDEDRLAQVFVNLLRNAVDALQAGDARGGGPEIAARAELSESEGRPWVGVTLTDNGPGIDPGVLARLFEPFASTRLDARGTGLGLAVAEGIVREHGGVILARNSESPGLGAVFEVVLPRADEGAGPEAASPAGAGAAP